MAARKKAAEAPTPSPAKSGKGKSPANQGGTPAKKVGATARKAVTPAKKAATLAKTTGTLAKSKNTKVSQNKVSKTPSTDGKAPYRFRWSKKVPNGQVIKIEQAETDANVPLANAGEVKAVSASKVKKAKISESIQENSMRADSPNTSKPLLSFNESVNQSEAGLIPSFSPATPRKFLFGTNPAYANSKDTEMKDADEVDDAQYMSDEYHRADSEDEADREELAEHEPLDVEVAAESPNVKHVGPHDPSVPRAINNMEKAKLRAKSTCHDPNGRHHGRVLVHWHREYFPFMNPMSPISIKNAVLQ
jgi:hypothetical protein